MNFIDVRFDTEFEKLDCYTSGGYDKAKFLTSTNPGEPVRSLGMVASGGKLSRIILAIRAVLADMDKVPTLIFDEIDTRTSGRTAQEVLEKLSYIGKSHQVICTTYLSQIAAVTDAHYKIVKSAVDGRTTTITRQLDYKQTIQEPARLSGGVEIMNAIYGNAREMKELAKYQGGKTTNDKCE